MIHRETKDLTISDDTAVAAAERLDFVHDIAVVAAERLDFFHDIAVAKKKKYI